MNDCPNDGQFLTHAFRIAAAGFVFAPGEPESGQVACGSHPRRARLQLIELDEEEEVLSRGQSIVETGILGQQADRPPQRLAAIPDREAANRRLAFGWREQAVADPYGRFLPRASRTHA